MEATVFGGASAQPGEPGYQDALKLGSLLALAGHTVITWGYTAMEVVSKGAALAGGHVSEVTCLDDHRLCPSLASYSGWQRLEEYD